jgi:hypothetical protein
MEWRHVVKLVMPGLVPGIHAWLNLGTKDVDGGDRPGHDEKANHLQVDRTIECFSVIPWETLEPPHLLPL